MTDPASTLTRRRRLLFAGALCCCLSVFLLPAQADSGTPPWAAIASAHPLATRAGVEMLERGGNAFDAAVAVSAALAVVEPAGSGLGGGGFWLLHRASDGFQTMLDGREKAPLAATRDMYLDQSGTPVPRLSIDGPLSAGIPGLPAALVHLSEHYGRLPLKDVLAPAIRYAREGFAVDSRMARLLAFRQPVLQRYPASAGVFLPEKGRVPQVGQMFRQPDLALTLERLAEKGQAGFYQGQTAELLVKAVRAHGGIWQARDLADYEVVEREPVTGQFRGIKVISAPPPSSGGIVLMEALNLLAPLQLGDGAQRKHWIVEAMRRAYYDRAVYLGDPDFVKIPQEMLLGAQHAVSQGESMQAHRATPSASFTRVTRARTEGHDTTHLSVIDREGNRVAATLSINYPFGSGFVAEGTGVLLNDEMDDFSRNPGIPNVYGLVGTEANSIAPGKRMLSSMSPTFLEDENRVAILGTPGGSRIISMVLLGVLDFAAGNGPGSWVAVPRFHHQYLPDAIQFEPDALSAKEQATLAGFGHAFKPLGRTYGNMQAILWDKASRRVEAASDPRGMGQAWVGMAIAETPEKAASE